MVLTPSIPAQAAALADELSSGTRRMYGRLEFDWNRNGLYDHAYSDLTEIWVSASGDRALTTDLPDTVSTPDGYASGQLTALLAGNLTASTVPSRVAIGTAALFDPDNRNSPIFSSHILGTPVRYSRVTQTVVGDVVLPVFTGFVRSAPFQRIANSVSITAADHLDVANAIATLPLWAVPTATPYGSWNWVSPPAARPIRATWAIEELLRQAGRPVGPYPRADCVGMMTCSGSMLPSFGYGSLSDYEQLGYAENHAVPLSYPNNWIVAPFGVAPNINTSDPADIASGNFTGNNNVTVTTDGSGAPTSRIGIGEYVYLDPADDPALPAVTYFYIGAYSNGEEKFDPLWEPPPDVSEMIQLRVSSNGRVVVSIRESPAMAGFRTWSWDTTYVLSAGWHYFNIICSFASGSVTATLTIDGVSQSMTSTSAPAGGFRYRTPAPTLNYQNGGVLSRTGKPNVMGCDTGAPPVHYIQFYAGDATLAFSSQQITAPTLANGKPPAVVNPAGLDIFWLPDTYRTNPWEVLKAITGAFYAALYTDEYGTVNWLEHLKLRVDVGTGSLSAVSLTDQQLDELTITPTDDSQRNSLVIPWTFRNAEEGTVWTQKNARDRPINVGGVTVQAEPTTEVISASNRIVKVSETPPDNSSLELDHRTGWVSAVQLDDPSASPSANDWGVGAFMNPGQRELGMSWGGPSFGEALFIGSYLEANQPSWNIAGAKYSTAIEGSKLVQNTASIAAIGQKTLLLSANPWMSVEDTARIIGEQLLLDLVNPASIISPVQLPADPRRQLLDVIRVTNEMGTGGAFYGQIISKAWSDDSSGSFMDTLTLRMTSTPGTFILDDAEFGVLDSPTLLG